jgi:hypothetical protein
MPRGQGVGFVFGELIDGVVEANLLAYISKLVGKLR